MTICTNYGESVCISLLISKESSVSMSNVSLSQSRFVLYKEKNMLLSENQICRQNGVFFPQRERQKKVKKSMAAIKTVLGERKRDKIAQHALKNLEEEDDEV